jgi:hypothetical protein
MKVVALLNWYEESPSWLAETVASAGKFCDHIIAVDGPYANFPGALKKPASGTEQAETIFHAAAGAGMGCTIHAPRQVWWGNEIEKRAYLMEVGQTITTEDDWFLVIDADEVLTDVPQDSRALLDAVTCDVAELTLWERDDLDSNTPCRRLFRALRGITYQQTHYTITAPSPDGGTKVLNGSETVHRNWEKAADLWNVRMEHRTKFRTDLRVALKNEYYARIPDFEHPEEIQ